MNEFSPLNEEYARDLVRSRREHSRHALPARPAERRTARRALASGLHRLADRLDG